MPKTKKEKQENTIIPMSELDFSLIDNIGISKKYYDLTSRIKSNVESIFDDYIKIGNYLKEIHDDKLYELEYYESIYDYASDKFDLPKTTVHNVMSISNRFTDENGTLLDEYKGLTFSTLVELVSVDKLDLDQYKNLVTVNEIRNKKREIKLNKLIDDSLSHTGSVSQLIEAFKSFDIYTALNNFDVRLTHEIIKEEFDPIKYRWGYNFKLAFRIDNLLIGADKLTFNVLISDSGYRFESWNPWITNRIEKLSDVDDIMTDYCKKVLQEIKKYQETTNKKVSDADIDKSPSFNSFKTVNKWSLINPIFNAISEAINTDVYYEFINNDNLAVYKEPKKNKKKNPVLFLIKYPNNLRDIQVLNADETPCEMFEQFLKDKENLMQFLKDTLKNIVTDKQDNSTKDSE